MEKENFKIMFCQIQVSWSFLLAAAELKTRHSLLVQQTAYFLALDTPPLASSTSFFGGQLEDVF